MERKERKNGQGFVYVGIGQSAATILGTAFWLILALILHPIAYGHLSWLVSIASLVSAVCVLGLGTTIASYYPKEKNERLLSTSVFLIFLVSILGGLVTAVILSNWVEILFAGLTGALVVAMSLFSVTFHSDLGKQEYKKYMWTWVGVRSASLLLPLALYYIWDFVAGLLAGLAAAYLLLGIWVLKYLSSGLDFGELRKKADFSIKAWGSSLGLVSLNFLDKVLIGALFTMDVLAVYQFGYRIFLLLSIVPNTLFFYLLPEKSGGNESRRVERAGILLSIGLALATLFLAPFIASHVFPGSPEGINDIRIMGLAVVPATMARIKSSQLFAEERANVVLGSSLFGLGIGITGIVVTFSQGLGLTGLTNSMIASQIGLLGGLVFFPVLLKLGTAGKIGLKLIGIAMTVILLVSSLNLISSNVTVDGEKFKGTHLAMGTVITIQVFAENKDSAREAIREAFNEIDRVESLMSEERSDTQIYHLNNSRAQWVELSPEVVYILTKAKEYGDLTGGHFDVTVKPLVDFWMEKVRKEGKMPTQDELAKVLQLVDYHKLIIDEANNRARLANEGMKITLGGIAKGYAIDRAIEVLRERGIQNAFVDIGGDIRVMGQRTWRIGIMDPRADGKLLGVIQLENSAIATSGDYRQYHLIGTVRIHHIINPKTSEPAKDYISVTIVAENALRADALATGIFAMGAEGGREVLDSIQVGGLMVNSKGEITTSAYWDYKLR